MHKFLTTASVRQSKLDNNDKCVVNVICEITINFFNLPSLHLPCPCSAKSLCECPFQTKVNQAVFPAKTFVKLQEQEQFFIPFGFFLLLDV